MDCLKTREVKSQWKLFNMTWLILSLLILQGFFFWIVGPFTDLFTSIIELRFLPVLLGIIFIFNFTGRSDY